MARYFTAEALLQDDNVKQRLINYLATHGGTTTVFIARYLLSGVACTITPDGQVRGGKAVPFGVCKDYLRACSAEFSMYGANQVALSYDYAQRAGIEITGDSAPVRNGRPARAHHHRGPPTSDAPPAAHQCKLCREAFTDQLKLNQHLGSNRHRIQHAVSMLKKKGALSSDQHGVQVLSDAPAWGLKVGQVMRRQMIVYNSNDHAVTLLRYSLLRRTPGISVRDELYTADEAMQLQILPSSQFTLTVEIAPQAVGILLDVLVLEFDGFSVLKEMTYECNPDIGLVPDISPVQAYTPKAPLRFQRLDTGYEAGEPPPRSKHSWKNPPGDTRVPRWLETLVEDGGMAELEAQLSRPCTDMHSVVDKLQRLLWVEELQHEVDIRQYDMIGATLHDTPGRRNVAFEVPGLAENRPSVMRGDALYVRPTGTSGREYQGFVYEVREKEVLCNFHSTIFYPGLKVDVRFSISRSTFVFMQAALVQARCNAIHPATLMGAEGMPPGTDLGTGTQSNPGAQRGLRGLLGGLFRASQAEEPAGYFESGLRTPGPLVREPNWTVMTPINEEQKTAVRAILSGAHAPLPYLIFGPPGTGKTMTLTEAAVQLHRTDTAARLLLAAPSNTAADQLMLRLMDKGVAPSQMIRICAYSRPKDDMHTRLLDNSNWDPYESAFLLDESLLPRIVSKRVVVCTCLMSAKLHALGVSQGHFTHILIDEAGHAEEPLTLAAVAGLITNTDKARLVLAGDPKQLGPVILSPLAQKLGLATSTMERLIHQRPYARQEGAAQPWNTTYITKLINNYRSHPDLLSLPNRLFYNGELVPMASRDQTHSLLGFKSLPNPNFPIIFHAVVGKDEREASSPSWFNQMEAKLVLQYIMGLLDMRANRPAPGDIGVISPYRKQVQKIYSLLRAKYGNSIKVGSVEEFQGQERRVVLVSTVRSSVDHLDFDKKHRLGFLANPKRFNVALTRAKALLIVVGNPDVLYRDPNWFDFLVHCYRNNGCTGSPMPDDVIQAARAAGTGTGSTPGPSTQRSAVDELADRLTSLTMNGGSGGGGGVHTSDVNYDRFMFSGPIQVEGGEMPRLE